jgi:hypothetical protein
MKNRTPPDWMPEEQKKQWEIAFGNLPKKKKSSPANQLTSDIMDYLLEKNCAAARINTTGIYDEKLGRYRKSGSTNGVEDVTCTYPLDVKGTTIGLTIAIEIKIGKDKMSDDQKKRKQRIELAGGIYIVAKEMEQFKDELEKNIIKYQWLK